MSDSATGRRGKNCGGKGAKRREGKKTIPRKKSENWSSADPLGNCGGSQKERAE